MMGDASHAPTSLPSQMLEDRENGALNLSTTLHVPPRKGLSNPLPKPVQRVYPAVQKTPSVDNVRLEGGEASAKACFSSMDAANEEDPIMDSHQIPLPRKERDFVPDHLKDATYWSRRMRNNIAARRSREKRRMADNILESKVSKLAQENEDLKSELANIKQILQEKLPTEPHRNTLMYARDDFEQRLDDYLPYPPEKRPRLSMFSPQLLPYQQEERPRLTVNLEQQLTSPRVPQYADSFSQYCSSFPEVPTRTSVLPPPMLPRLHRLDCRPPQVCHGPRPLLGGTIHHFPSASRVSNSGPCHVVSEKSFVSGVTFGLHKARSRHPSSTLVLPARNMDIPAPPRSIAQSKQILDEAEKIVMDRVLPRSGPTVPSGSLHERRTHLSVVPLPEIEILSSNDTPCPSKDPCSTSASLSLTLSDSTEALSPSEINKLPHKLRAKMLRALPHHKDPIPTQAKKSEQCVSTDRESIRYDESIIANIKTEKVDDEEEPESGASSTDEQICNNAAPADLRLVRPKQEFIVHHMRSIEEELEQVHSLLATPVPARTMTSEESEAYAEMVRAAALLVDARLTVNDFTAPTVRHQARQRTRDMSAEEKYRDKRARNNIAAKKCRDAKRLLNEYRAARSKFFDVENITLQNELEELTSEVLKLRELARIRNCSLTQ